MDEKSLTERIQNLYGSLDAPSSDQVTRKQEKKEKKPENPEKPKEPEKPEKPKDPIDGVADTQQQKNTQAGCICNRERNVYKCSACGRFVCGRFAKVCTVHPSEICSLDLRGCPHCDFNFLTKTRYRVENVEDLLK
ncbi:uncharacterized protein DMAD_01480 [Drosophila madeirensis]|uniref:Uncharacterized protein n=1 Tax=Drosophila madeirensis TaxID=30013 RepID=A0AAU9G009_DROMD